jgi:hypothetical protein
VLFVAFAVKMCQGISIDGWRLFRYTLVGSYFRAKGGIMKMRALYIMFACSASLLLVGWTLSTEKLNLPKQYKIKNIQSGVAKGYEDELAQSLCSNFKLTEPEIRQYFSNANVISSHIREYGYDWLPCYVQGDLLLKGKPAQFRIEASATGWIKYPDGKTVWLGCKEACAELFKHK